MKFRIYYILLCLLICSGSISGQINGAASQAVFYEDGSVFKGLSIKEDDNLIHFKLHEMLDTLVLDKNLIKKTISYNDIIIYPDDSYHKKVGSIYAVSFHAGGAVFNRSFQVEFTRFKLFPKYALGVGLAYHGSQNAPHSSSKFYDFAEVFVYSKYFVNNNRLRFFGDMKLGGGIPLKIDDWLNYSPGLLLQPGIGIDIANGRRGKLSFHFRRIFQFTTIEKYLEGFRGTEFTKEIFSKTTVGFGWNF